jgi:hypothetical protein
MISFGVPRTSGTNFDASAITYALVRIEGYVRLYINRLRITTPGTAQGASLQEYNCSYTGTVVQAVSLNIENSAPVLLKGRTFLCGTTCHWVVHSEIIRGYGATESLI